MCGTLMFPSRRKKAELYFLRKNLIAHDQGKVFPNEKVNKQVIRTHIFFFLFVIKSNMAVVNKTSRGPHSSEPRSSESRPPEQLVQFASWWFCFPGHWKVEPVMVLLGKTELQLLRSLSTEKYLGPHSLLSIKKKPKPPLTPVMNKQNQANC